MKKKSYINESCYDMAVARLDNCFRRFDKVVVSFSGGKDSTVCLQMAIDSARKAGKLPLDVVTFDEEAIPPETVEYMTRIAQIKDINLRWMCVPIKHRNACSERQPDWFPWAEEDREKWVRPLPPLAITSIPGMVRGMAIPECTPLIYGPEYGSVCVVMGIRCDESMSRYSAIARKKSSKNAYLSLFEGAKWINKCYPIYDWHTNDVWKAPNVMGWDYNHAYDVMELAGITRHNQRCAPPFGEQPIRGLHQFKACWPELWGKMVDRVAGAATAARYANTELYGMTLKAASLPSGTSWREYTTDLIDGLSGDAKQEVAKAIKGLMVMHNNRTKDPIPDEEPHPISGFSWLMLCRIAKIGGNKFNRQSQKVANEAINNRKANGILK
jgi:predicted phosphoadenosine phosphosulfate sulfurtransferase